MRNLDRHLAMGTLVSKGNIAESPEARTIVIDNTMREIVRFQRGQLRYPNP